MASEYLTLEEVLQELQVDKPDLDRLIEQGQLRQLRDGGAIKFRREDVDKIKRSAETDATVVFDDSDPGEGSGDDSGSGIDAKILDLMGDGQTVISPPEEGAAQDSSDSDIDSGLFDEDETSKVELQFADAEDSSADDSDQTSIIPVGVAPDATQDVGEEEESIFDFGDEDEDMDSSPSSDSDSSGSDISDIAGEPTVAVMGDATVALESDSSSDILEAESDSSDIVDTGEDSSSDILDLAVEDSGTESAVDLDEAPGESDVVTDLLDLGEGDSSDTLDAVSLEDAESTDARTSETSDEVPTLEDADGTATTEAAPAVGQDSVDTADTVDLTLADTSDTMDVEEVQEEEEEDTGPAMLTMADDEEEPDADGEPAGPEEEKEEEPPWEEPVAPMPSYQPLGMFWQITMFLSATVLAFGGIVLYNLVRGRDLPLTSWATKMAMDYISKK